MSGGGAPMKAAAKMAALGGGLASSSVSRGGVPLAAAEHLVRYNKATMPVSQLSSSSVSVRESASVQKSSWEIIDEWEYEGEIPRVVFGGAPSFQEAEEATSELKEAVELVYLSSENSPNFQGPSKVAQKAGLASLTKSQCLETKSCVSTHTIASPSVPNHALQAFKFLSETPAAQTVVASVASDPNVWNAVLQNPALVDFMHSCKINAPLPSMDVNSGESVPDDLGFISVIIVENLSKLSQIGNPLNDVVNILQNIKLTVLEMVSRVSDLLQDIFGPPVDEKSSDSGWQWPTTFVEKTIEASVMGLAVLAIIVVVLKRN